mgnify:CR=1 FL=1
MKQQREERDYNIRSVERALNALQCFNGESREMSLMEFSRMLSLNKSTTFRILTTLRNMGFLEMDDNGKYRLGAEIARLGRLTDGVSLLKREGQPVLQKLAELSGETLAICKYENGRMTCIAKVESEKVLKCICVLDSDVPMLKGATGRSALAYLSEEELRRCIDIQRMIGNPDCGYEELKKVLEEIRRSGYYVSYSEYDENVNALAVPIFGKGGEVIGSLSIVGPDSRFAGEAIIKILPDVIRETRILSEKLGYESEAPKTK